VSDIIKLYRLEKSTVETSPGGLDILNADINMSVLYSGPQDVIKINPDLDAVAQVLTFSSDTTQGWSNQELADFYRTHRLLALAGIATEIDHGKTDEGDPWCVFMDAQNEVFVHFSRFDGVCMVSSQVQDKPIWGNSLADLITEFSKSVQPAAQAGHNPKNIVSIVGRSRNTVMIHPAAALAALVWSIYLMSDELVAAIPSMAPGLGDDHPHTEPPIAAVDIEALPDLAKKAMISIINPTLTGEDLGSFHGRAMGLGAQIASLPSSLSMKVVGLGLSFAAISVGLPLLKTILTDAPLEPSELGKDPLHATFFEIKAAALSAVASIQILEDAHAATVARVEAQVEAEYPHHATVNQAPIAQPIIEIKATQIDIDFSKDVHGYHEPGSAAFSHSQDETPPHEPLVVEAASQGQSPTTTQDTLSPNDTDHSLDTTFFQRVDQALVSIDLTSLNTLSQPEFVRLIAVNDTIKFVDDSTPVDQYATFDENAQKYLDFIVHNYGDVEILAASNKITFVSAEAINSADAEHPVYTKSWIFDDGSVISTVGLKSDMEMFHLVA
jgi:hypothetical protein